MGRLRPLVVVVAPIDLLLLLGRGLHDRFGHLLHGRVHHSSHRILRRFCRLLLRRLVVDHARQVGGEAIVGQSV